VSPHADGLTIVSSHVPLPGDGDSNPVTSKTRPRGAPKTAASRFFCTQHLPDGWNP